MHAQTYMHYSFAISSSSGEVLHDFIKINLIRNQTKPLNILKEVGHACMHAHIHDIQKTSCRKSSKEVKMSHQISDKSCIKQPNKFYHEFKMLFKDHMPGSLLC